MDYEQYLINLTFEYLDIHFPPEEVEKILAENPLTGTKGIRRLLGAIDYEYFARAYFPDYCFHAPCQFHHEQYREMRWIEKNAGGIKEIIAAPRESAKSTIWNTIYPTHQTVYKKRHYIVIISDSSTQAEDDLKKIKNTIEENEYILEDFGNLKGKDTWKTDAILTKTGVLLIARGSGKRIRGIKHKHYRPDLIILDDVENDENVQSPDQRAKLMNWFDKVVTKAGSNYTDIIMIGTVLHLDSLLYNLLTKRPGYRTKIYKAVIEDSKSPLWIDWEKIYTDLSNKNRADDAREFFEANKEEMTAGVELIWPEAKDIYYYREALINEGPAAYNSEFQNNPVDENNMWVTKEDFQYYDDEGSSGLPDLDICVVKGALDPSMGKNEKSDLAPICTVARDLNGYLYVVESDACRRNPDKQIEDIFTKHEKYNYREFYIEDVAFQAYLASNVQKASAKNGTYINIVTEPKPKGDKHARIKGQLQPMIKNGYIKFSVKQKSLVMGLIYLDFGKYDDEPEALQMVCALFSSFNKEFTHSMMPDITGINTKW